MILAVRSLALRGEAPQLRGVSSGQVVGHESRALTFEIAWDGVTIEHRLPIPEQGGIRAYHTDPVGPSTGSLPWTLTEGNTVVGEGRAYTYIDDYDGRDVSVIDFGGAVPSLMGAMVYADDPAEIVRELELVTLADLVGRDDLPLPEPIDW